MTRVRTRIAVVRALFLGDMLCAVPALRAIRAGNPDAHITLVGLPWARELAARLTRYVDAFEAFPGFPGIPERDASPPRIVEFLARMQTQRFDLAVQLHGSGSHINEFVALLGAAHMAAFHRDGDVVITNEAFVPWMTTGSEVERLLALPRALGWPVSSTELELDVHDSDRAALDDVLRARAGTRPYVCIHAGARFASRRWAPSRFAAIGDVLARRGFTVVLTGTESETSVTRAVRDHMRAPVVDLTGRLSLGTLAATIEGAELVVCNDTGISHLAAAVGTRTVVVASGSDVARWAPTNHQRHRVLWHDVPCRPCMHEICPTGHECANGVGIADVLSHAEQMLDSGGRAYA